MFEQFLQSVQNMHTRRAYSQDLDVFRSFYQGDLEDLTAADLDAYRSALLAQGLSPSTINRRLSGLRALLSWRSRVGYRSEVTGATLRGVRSEDRLPQVLKPRDALRLIHAAPAGSRDRALLWFLYTSGVRLSEAVNLRVEHLDFERRAARVLGKGSKEREVFFSTKAADALVAYLDGRDTGYVFLNKFGKQIGHRWVQETISRLAQEIGLGHVHPHQLRHTFATQALEKTGDLAYVQAALGHASPETTYIYTRTATSRYAAQHARVFEDE